MICIANLNVFFLSALKINCYFNPKIISSRTNIKTKNPLQARKPRKIGKIDF